MREVERGWICRRDRGCVEKREAEVEAAVEVARFAVSRLSVDVSGWLAARGRGVLEFRY